LLDPYGLHVDWSVVKKAGEMKSMELFYNFIIMDANMNVFLRNPEKVQKRQAERMDAVWGDHSWTTAAYKKTQGLFEQLEEKLENRAVAQAFQERLRSVAGFAYVPEPLPMRNSTGAIVYYLFFASPNKTGNKIVEHIFNKYRNKGVR